MRRKWLHSAAAIALAAAMGVSSLSGAFTVYAAGSENPVLSSEELTSAEESTSAQEAEETSSAASTEETQNEETTAVQEETTQQTSDETQESSSEEQQSTEALSESVPAETETSAENEIISAQAATQPGASPLIVTEIVPVAGPSGSRLTYTEVYNNSDATINMGEYTFYYQYPNGGGQVWNTGDFNIEPGECIVLWQSNSSSWTVEDFNAYYGTDLVEGEDIYRINYGGIHSTDRRGFAFGRDEDSIIAYAECNVDGADIASADRQNGWAVQYEYPGIGTTSYKSEVSDATPGTVADWQVPAEKVHYESPAAVSISEVNGPETAQNDAVTVTAKITGNQGGAAVKLHFVQGPGNEETVDMTYVDGTDTVTATIPSELLWDDQISWYITASYGEETAFAQSDSYTTNVQYPELSDEEKAPLVVTEVVTPPTSTGEYAGNTQFSYVELYNRTSSPVNYGYFYLFYEYTNTTTADKQWSCSEPVMMIEPGETLVVWLTSNGNTVEDFNTFYGVDLVEGEDIVTINYAGFHNTQWRTLKFGRSADTIFARAQFNINGVASIDSDGQHSIQYTYPRTADGESLIVSTDMAPSPGTVEDWQVPDELSNFTGYAGYPEDDGTAPSLSLHDTCPTTIMEGDQIKVIFDISDNMGLVGERVHYRLDGGEWQYTTESNTRVPYYYVAQISADVLFGHDNVEFYVEAFNNFRSTTTPIYSVDIQRLNDVNGVRLNVADDTILSGVTTITANDGGSNADTKIQIDGQEVETIPMLEDGAYFAFTATDRNSYFKNAVTAPYGDNEREIISYVVSWGNDTDSKAVHIDNKYFTYNEEKDCYEVTLTMWAGDSGTPFEDIYLPSENHEDYKVSQVRLMLANGKTYLPTEIGPDDPETSAKTNLSTALSAVHSIGDSSGWCPRMDVTFEIPASDVTAVGYELDTTALSDGVHTITATAGSRTDTAEVIVDNTIPVINMGIEEGAQMTGTLTIDPQVTDANGLAAMSVILNGEEITVPYSQAVRDMAEGTYELTVLAEDLAGNLAQETVTFQIGDVNPVIASVSTDNVTADSADLSVALEDVNTEGAEVSFYKGKNLTVENGDITVKTGEGDEPLAVDLGSRSIEVTSPTGDLPYQMFTINTGDLTDGDSVFVNWSGSSNYADASHAIKMYVLNTAQNDWEVIGTPDADGNIEVSFGAKDHVSDGKAIVLVQCRAEASNPVVTASDETVKAAADEGDVTSSWDGTGVPEDYDFSFAWITDTQYYTESYPEHFYNQNQWIVDNADELKIKYVIHTGDIVDEYDMIGQWEVADKAMGIFDEAGMPYGVLGGNHDVAAGGMLYQNYWNYFGEDRFADKSYYGGSYNNNAGHYDLISQNGQDFILLYMSWDIYTEELEWMNQVLQQYSDRTAILLFHRYTNVSQNSGTYLDYAGKVVQEQVVAKNPNVVAVLNGHYHGASFETTAFDDDGDGVKERTVYQICTDYQSGFEGGAEYIKMLYFDLDAGKIYMNSYSPLLNDFNYYDTPKYESYEEGNSGNNIDIYELNVDFDTSEKTLECSQFSAGIRTDEEIGTAEVNDLTAGVSYSGLDERTGYSWYAKVTNDKGGLVYSDLQSFTTKKANNFTDVADDAWYKDAVDYVYQKDIMTGMGTDETTFAPNDTLVRAMFAQALHRVEGEPETAYTAQFPDVAQNDWFAECVTWAADTGIVGGYSNGYFGPADNIVRGQIAIMMYRYAQYKGYDMGGAVDISGYTDAALVDDYMKDAMEWAVGNGIITGKYDQTVLDPYGYASRAECATIIMRFMETYMAQ